jgi:hypothetical protein
MSQKWVKQWKVSSWKSSGNDLTPGAYTVSLSVDGEWGCSCPRWKFKREECKHIREIQAQENWKKGDPTAALRLTALRIEKLKAKGKTEQQIEKDLLETFAQMEIFTDGNS